MKSIKTPGELVSLKKIPGFGGASISGEGGGYGFGTISEGHAIELVQHAYNLGVRVFDTAPIYGFGLSEKRLGKALKNLREDVIIVNKGGVTWTENKRVQTDNRPATIQRMLEQSLRDLGTEYIDIYMIHWPDPRVDIREPLAILTEAQRAGKIRWLGLSNTFLGDLQKAEEVADIRFVQGVYNLFDRSLEVSLQSELEQRGIGFLSWGVFDKGILTGRVVPDRRYDQHDARSWAPWWKGEDRSKKFACVKRLSELCHQSGYSLSALAFHSVTSNPVVTSALCGSRTTAQWDDTIACAAEAVPSDVIESARRLVQEEFS